MKKNLDEKKLSFFANKRFSGKTVLITGATSESAGKWPNCWLVAVAGF